MNTSRFYYGIDPGASGGLACIHERLVTVPMPATERDVFEWFRPLGGRDHEGNEVEFAVIEKVGGYTASGGPQPGSAMFKFGQSYGGLRMALIAAGIPFEEVTPQRWQKALGVTPRGKEETKTSFKNRLKAKAQQLFPKIKVTLATADAILLAEYCKRSQEGRL